MSTLASSLLDFILDLFRDPEKAAAYDEDPQAALDAAGLGDLSPDDVADLMPMVADYSTVGGWSGGNAETCDGDGGGRLSGVQSRSDRDDDREHSGGSHHSPARDEDDDEDDEEDDDDDQGSHGHAPAGGHETVVITHLQEIQYENHETHVSIDASHSIWVSGDAQAIFGDDNVLVGGDGVAAGGDVEDVTQIDNEGGIVAGDDVEDAEIETDNSTTENEIGGDGIIGNGNGGNEIGNSETDVDVDLQDVNVNTGDGTLVDESENVGNATNSFNEDTAIADRGGQVGDDVDVDLEDSFNDNSDNSTDVDVDLDVDESFNDNSEDSSVNDSLNDNEILSNNEDNSEDNDFNNNDENAFAMDEALANTGPVDVAVED